MCTAYVGKKIAIIATFTNVFCPYAVGYRSCFHTVYAQIFHNWRHQLACFSNICRKVHFNKSAFILLRIHYICIYVYTCAYVWPFNLFLLKMRKVEARKGSKAGLRSLRHGAFEPDGLTLLFPECIGSRLYAAEKLLSRWVWHSQMPNVPNVPFPAWSVEGEGGGGNGGSSLTGLRVLLLVKKYVYFTVHFSPLCNNEVISFYVFREFWPSWAPVLCIENPNPCDHGNSFLKEVIRSNERVLFNSPSPLRLGRFNSVWAPEFWNHGKSVKVIELFSLVSFFPSENNGRVWTLADSVWCFVKENNLYIHNVFWCSCTAYLSSRITEGGSTIA